MRKRMLLFSLAGCVLVPLVNADCLNGIRPPTEAEKTFHVSTMTALKAAIPSPPAGWRITRASPISGLGSVCVDAGDFPAALRYDAIYFWQEGNVALSARRAENRRQEQEALALPAEQQKQADELAKRSRDLDRQARKAVAAGNKDDAGRLNQESAELAKQANAIHAAHRASVTPKMRAMVQERTAEEKVLKTEVRVEFAVNWAVPVALSGETTRLALANVPLALRSGEKTVLCFGPWKATNRNTKIQHTELKSDFKPGAPSTVVQTIVVRLTGTPKQVDDVLAAMDTRSLAALLGR